MGLLHHNDSPLGAPAAPAWGGHGAQQACKEPARMVHGACKECARGVQAACKNGARSVQGVCKEPTRTVRGVARNTQEVHKGRARSKELGHSLHGACKECATSVHLAPRGSQTKSKGAIAPCAPAGQRDGAEEGTDRTDRPHFSVPKSKPAEGRTHCISKEQ